MSQVREEAVLRIQEVYEKRRIHQKINCNPKAVSCIVENRIVKEEIVVESQESGLEVEKMNLGNPAFQGTKNGKKSIIK